MRSDSITITLPNFKKNIRNSLEKLGIDHAECVAEAEMIVAFVSRLSSLEQVLFEDDVPLEWRQKAEEILGERTERVPLQYILGSAYFMGLQLMVAPGVFIPRSDTEILIEMALNTIGHKQAARIIDIGTGSGAIAIALAKRLPTAVIEAIELSECALDLAKKNAQANSVADSITFVHADWRQCLPRQADLIVSNPPYIPLAASHSLPEEVIGYEPHLALFGEGEDGLGHYRELSLISPLCFDKSGGHIILEFGDGREDAVSTIFYQAGFTEIKIVRDLQGKPRAISTAWRKG